MTEDKNAPLFGFYRALVVDNKDPEMYGRIMVWIPDIMPKVDQSKGLWALPANNAIGGRNLDGDSSHQYMGQCIIPGKGSWIWIFFEAGDSSRPFYFNALDLKNGKVLPECQLGSNYQQKWVIFKSHEGRCFIVSDDSDDCRVEITGKKRNISNPPEGDKGSVYEIDGNQTTILLDERDGKQKLLIRTYKGDFINIDIENETLNISFVGDIQIKTTGKLNLKCTDDINLKSAGNINLQSIGDINLLSGGNVNSESTIETNIKSGTNLNCQALQTINNLASGPINSDGASISDMSGAATPAGSADSAEDANPIGTRD